MDALLEFQRRVILSRSSASIAFCPSADFGRTALALDPRPRCASTQMIGLGRYGVGRICQCVDQGEIMRKLVVSLLSLASLAAVGCEASKSSNPLSPSVAGPIAGVSIAAPQPVSPSSNTEIAIGDQPVTLTVKNATTTGVRPLSYMFEVATDSSFSQKVYSRASVPPGDGQTSHRLADVLSAARTYYWRARAEDGANTGGFTGAVAFTIYIPVVIQAPVAVSPINDALASSVRPTMIIANAARSGPAGTIFYSMQVASDAAFTQTAWAGDYPEQTGNTSMTVGQDLTAGRQFFWRVKASDGKNEGPWTPTQVFRTPTVAPSPTPNPSPTPTPNPGPPAAGDMINMSQATILNSPAGLANWTIAAGITRIDLTTDGVHIEVSPDKLNGPNRWPEASFGVQYTLGMCLNINGHWYCSAVVQFWTGLSASGGPPSQYAQNWFYDPSRWSPMTGHQPAQGETIGFFACMGDCRNNTTGDLSPLKERTNVVLVPMPGPGGATYRF
jgi:hypothetical protein